MAGVYISYPFCAQKCSFCNFASGPESVQRKREYLSAIAREIADHQWAWVPETVYLGGGTPSQLDGDDLAAMLRNVPGRPWHEATIEAAPGTLTPEKVRAWREVGINRVSLGVQSFDSAELRATGRRHDAGQVAADCRLLAENGLHNINIDLIAGLPHQTRESWDDSLRWIERLAAPHLSVYLFEIDEDSRLGLEVLNGGSRYGAATIPDGDLAAELYDIAVERAHSMGIERYEISNFAVPGHESKHNLKYWTLQPYVGFGADAHSFDGASRWSNPESAAEYVSRGALRTDEPVNLDEERLFTGLRLTGGLEFNDNELRRYSEALDRFQEGGLLERNGRHVRLTNRGVLLSSEVFQEFVQG